MAEIHLPRWRRGGAKKEQAFYFFLSFLAFKTDGSLYAERKCVLTGLAHGRWLPSNDNNGIGGECEQQCSLLSSDDAQTDGLQPADTVALAPGLAVTHPTNVKRRTNCTRDMLETSEAAFPHRFPELSSALQDILLVPSESSKFIINLNVKLLLNY